MSDELLFNRGDIFSVIQAHTDALKKNCLSLIHRRSMLVEKG